MMPFDEQGRLAALKRAASLHQLDRRFLVVGRCVFYLLLGLTLSCARVRGNGAPFGMAMVTAAGPGLSGVFALSGAALGYLISGGVEWGIRYIAASVLIYTIAFIFQELALYRRSFFMPTAAALVMALTGVLGSFTLGDEGAPWIAQLFLETSLAFGGSYFFRSALVPSPRSTETAEMRKNVSVMILLSCLLMALSRLQLFHTVSIGRFLALLMVMSCAMKGGLLSGAAVGTVLGLSMDLAAQGTPVYTLAYAFGGLLSGVFGKHGRLFYTLSFILSQALAVVCVWQNEVYISILFETFAASVIFMLFPAALLNQLGLLLQSMERGNGESGLRRFVAVKVRALSDVYGELYETVRGSLEAPHNDENMAKVFDRAADRVCVGCKDKNRCWNTAYMDTLSAMNDATQAMRRHGSLAAEDLPGYFREHCLDLGGFITAVNAELRSLAYRQQLRSRLSESRSLLWDQYRDMAQMLGRLSEELGSVNGSDPLAERRLIRYLRSLDIDAETSVYRDGGGRLRVIIESGRLTPLTKDDDYLEKLSSVVGVRLCQPRELSEESRRLTLLEAEPLAVSVGIASMKKRGEKVSGDKGSYFKTDAGVLCVILSDGMGAGDEAARDSEQVVSILERFLRSGVDGAVAMKVLNSVMLLRSADCWGCATVDLMCVDLFTGETCFYKYGAAPSYVKNGKNIRRIQSETLAAGLNSGDVLAPDVVRMRLRPGSTAIIASDGVIVDAEDGWLKSLLQKNTEDMKELARSTLKEAETLYGALDDMTVVTVRVEERV